MEWIHNITLSQELVLVHLIPSLPTLVPVHTGSRRGSRSPSPAQRHSSPSASDKGAYVVQAGRLITQALAYEGSGDYEEAFDLYKAGVDLLLNGVQSEVACMTQGSFNHSSEFA